MRANLRLHLETKQMLIKTAFTGKPSIAVVVILVSCLFRRSTRRIVLIAYIVHVHASRFKLRASTTRPTIVTDLQERGCSGHYAAWPCVIHRKLSSRPVASRTGHIEVTGCCGWRIVDLLYGQRLCLAAVVDARAVGGAAVLDGDAAQGQVAGAVNRDIEHVEGGGRICGLLGAWLRIQAFQCEPCGGGDQRRLSHLCQGKSQHPYRHHRGRQEQPHRDMGGPVSPTG